MVHVRICNSGTSRPVSLPLLGFCGYPCSQRPITNGGAVVCCLLLVTHRPLVLYVYPCIHEPAEAGLLFPQR